MNPIVLDHFGLRRYPFTPEIPASALYPFKSFHQGTLRLEQAVSQRGMALVMGDSGAGKTALVRSFTDRLAPSSHQVYSAAALPSKSSLRSVVEELLVQFGEPIPFNNTARGMSLLHKAIARRYQQGQLPVVTIDDVHYFSPSCWQFLKGLTNHEMDSRVPLLVILMGAREELGPTLGLSRLEEVRNRFLFCFHHRGLLEEEIGPYLEAHLKWAGCDRPLFPREIAKDIHKRAHELPRHVNRLAHGCLMAAAFDRKDLVDGPCLEQATSELLFTTKS